MSWSAWPAPAKLNLFLHIVGRRDDGYHLLQTAFRLLDWGDTVHLRLRTDDAIARVSPLPGVDPDDDLTLRAARLLRRQAGGALPGVDVRVDKRIPMGGGLGGGSSDAATTLVALNVLWGLGRGVDELADLGLELGADVPLFVRGRSAWAEGVGERLTPLELAPCHYVIVDPHAHVSTQALYTAPQLTRDASPATIRAFLHGEVSGNAFEPVLRARSVPVASALDWLGRFGPAALSGSGGCVFLATSTPEAAQRIAAACPAPFTAHVARGVNVSGLARAVEKFGASRDNAASGVGQ